MAPILRVCNVCGAPSEQTYCPAHRKRRRTTRAPSSSLSRHRFNRTREMVIKRECGTCQVCGDEGEEVHHGTAVADGNPDPYDPDLCLLVCERCHRLAGNNGATLAELRAEYRRLKARGLLD